MTPENQRPAIQRTTGNDLTALATESAAPMQVAAILVLDRPVETAALRADLAVLRRHLGRHDDRRPPALPRPAAVVDERHRRLTYLPAGRTEARGTGPGSADG